MHNLDPQEVLRRTLTKSRRLGAGGFPCSWPDKARVELDATATVVRNLNRAGRSLRDVAKRPETSPRTSPDCVLYREEGGLIGVEATELVEPGVIPQNIDAAEKRVDKLGSATSYATKLAIELEHGMAHKVCVWQTVAALQADLDRIIRHKSAKLFAPHESGARYAERWLVIYSCERFLPPWEEIRAELEAWTPSSRGQFDAAHFLLFDALHDNPSIQIGRRA